MPTYARRQIVVEDMVGVYHCIARCDRRAFLCGIDPYTGKDYSHRKEWILDRMRELAGLFAIEVCGYSVTSNHLHLVLRNRPDVAEQWSADEIALRWCRIFPPRHDAAGETVEPNEHDTAMLTANSERLAEPSTDISIRLPLEERWRLARSTHRPTPFRQGEPFHFARQVISSTRRSSRFGRAQAAPRTNASVDCS